MTNQFIDIYQHLSPYHHFWFIIVKGFQLCIIHSPDFLVLGRSTMASTPWPMARRCPQDFCHEVDPERQDPGAAHAGAFVSLRFDHWVTWNPGLWLRNFDQQFLLYTSDDFRIGGAICILFGWFGNLTQFHRISLSILGIRSCWFLTHRLSHSNCRCVCV